MTKQPHICWSARDKRAFLDLLADSGDPVAAARQVVRPVVEAFALRDSDPGFAAGWARAVNIAWEQVEFRVLAALLMQPDPADTDKPAKPKLQTDWSIAGL
ncbi:hypothetical protein [Sandarakinorhabdus sp.]|uniref:hypothetical protein n=1 Tax=Sandarakinorhabdus sp. TaxID=1916663 RepID=UPI00286E1DC0|nr:hypothetical protein [Sandarakinorhabdus sp.]